MDENKNNLNSSNQNEDEISFNDEYKSQLNRTTIQKRTKWTKYLWIVIVALIMALAAFLVFRNSLQQEEITEDEIRQFETSSSSSNYKVSKIQDDLEAYSSVPELVVDGEDYSPANLIDQDPSTSWVEGILGTAEKDRIYLENKGDEIATISAIKFVTGKGPDESSFENFCYPTEFGLEFNEDFSLIELEPTVEEQIIEIDPINIEPGGGIALAISGIKHGANDVDGNLAISDITLMEKE